MTRDLTPNYLPAYVHRKTCMRMFMAALSIIAKIWKPSWCLSVGKWNGQTHEVPYINMKETTGTHKKNESRNYYAEEKPYTKEPMPYNSYVTCTYMKVLEQAKTNLWWKKSEKSLPKVREPRKNSKELWGVMKENFLSR